MPRLTDGLDHATLPIDPYHMPIRRIAGHVYGCPVLGDVDPRTIAAERPIDVVDDWRLWTDQ